jgi:hypothetical protein
LLGNFFSSFLDFQPGSRCAGVVDVVVIFDAVVVELLKTKNIQFMNVI